MPASGVQGFPDNYLMTSLSDTIASSESSKKPTPKPRRSLGQPQVQPADDDDDEKSLSTTSEDISACASKICPSDSEPNLIMEPQFAPSAPLPCEGLNEQSTSCNLQGEYGVVSSSSDLQDLTNLLDATAAVPSQIGEEGTGIYANVMNPTSNRPFPSHSDHDSAGPSVYPQLEQLENPSAGNLPHRTAPIGWNISYILPNVSSGIHPQNTVQGNNEAEGMSTHQNIASGPSQPLYPAVPEHSENPSTACTENLVLKFGKQGSSVRDFLKPIGLAVSKEGNYIISDSSSDQNRIFVFNSRGELTAAFSCGCKVKDVTVTKANELLVAVHKQTSAIRHFTMTGQIKGEYGKFFTFEEPCGIGELRNGGVAFTGIQSHCIYVLTDKFKLATKFGRKGNGDGYFQHPAFIAVDSKNHIIITDKVNCCVQVFDSEGKFKHRFADPGNSNGQLQAPLGVCVDDIDNIIVADSGNFRVEVFSPRGLWLSTVVAGTHELGDGVKPVNVAFTPKGQVAVLLRGPYFAEVRIYTSRHKEFGQKDGHVSTDSSVWFSKYLF